MAPDLPREKNRKKFLSKNKSVKLFKAKQKKIELYNKQIEHLTKQYDQIDFSIVEKFQDFPLTDRTQKALKRCKYETPTEIQKESIGLALKGHDILGAAKTGSGKTLAFVIPILECLFRSGWSIMDGLGAVVITPTRELAYQIFEVFNKVGSFHDFSVALVIGGKDLQKERRLMDKCNIVICTPGRLLQHMDENPLFDTLNLQMLVLDEADRILDLGFEKTMNAIIQNFPAERQTLLFSATQTKSVKDLARLSLKNPMYVSVHEHAKHSTPESLQQSYLECEAHSKLDLLWSFLKSHKKQKIIVFMASCKQVKYAFDVFCRMKPGISLTALYGSLHQLARMQRYDDFCNKMHVVMFATDIAARGLDFPNVNWVVQLDCPEDVNTYIHRVGRTARYENGGEALLILLPSEKDSMIKQLEARKIPISEIKVSPTRMVSVQRKMEALCARDVALKDSAQRAFKAYFKNIFLMKDKSVFDVAKLDPEAYARSLGLAFAPRIRFIAKRMKSQPATENTMTEEPHPSTEPKKITYSQKEFDFGMMDDSDDELLTAKKSGGVYDGMSDDEDETSFNVEENNDGKMSAKSKKPLTKAALAKKLLKKNIKPNMKVVFDEDGQIVDEFHRKQKADIADEMGKQMLEEGYNIEKAKLIMEKEDIIDKEIYREKIKTRHTELRRKLKKERKEANDEKSGAELATSEGNLNATSENEDYASSDDGEDLASSDDCEDFASSDDCEDFASSDDDKDSNNLANCESEDSDGSQGSSCTKTSDNPCFDKENSNRKRTRSERDTDGKQKRHKKISDDHSSFNSGEILDSDS